MKYYVKDLTSYQVEKPYIMVEKLDELKKKPLKKFILILQILLRILIAV